MRAMIGCGVVLLSAMGIGTEAAGVSDAVLAGNRGLSPIIVPIVLAQAATPGTSANPQPDYILNACKETESAGDPTSAMRAVDPASWLATYLGNRDNRIIDMATRATIKPTLLQGTQHGNLLSSVSNTGRTTYHYDPTPNYIGNDRAVFLAEFEGKVYKIVLELKVLDVVVENLPLCPPPQLIKVTKPAKPSSGATSFGAGYDLSSITVTFADLNNRGQTTVSINKRLGTDIAFC